MRFCEVVIDNPARALSKPFTYAIDPSTVLHIGETVLVPFGSRRVIGYVVSLSDTLDPSISSEKIKPVLAVLSSALFGKPEVVLATWISREYASPFLQALKLFFPAQHRKRALNAAKEMKPIDTASFLKKETWVALTSSADITNIRAGAVRQREVLHALSHGAMRISELAALIDGARQVVRALEKRGMVSRFETERDLPALTTTLSSAQALSRPSLTDEQTAALLAIRKGYAKQDGSVVLVDGVTGSGKTEVYLSAIEEVLKQGKTAIVLVPEISLTAQTVGRFRTRFGDAIGLLHSKMSDTERAQEWYRIQSGACKVVIGARSALFAPLQNVGIVVIDEEHETSYKQENAPRYHARDVAARLAKASGAVLVLGSGTPSEEALYNAQTLPHWTRVLMTKRPGGATFPSIEIVDMKRDDAKKRSEVFSEALLTAIQETYYAQKKSILLLNRRGFSTFLQCEDCGCVPTCPHCSTSLTYHVTDQELVCHTCSRTWPYAAFPSQNATCPNCGSRFLKQVGVGTERVEKELQAILPEAPIVRMDADSTRKKEGHTKLLEQFDSTPGAILLGTQMIAKGLDFPEVTLVGVINADVSLKLPDFRAPEKTFDLLEQVAGRAGRGVDPGRVIIQTSWPNHSALLAVQTHSRELFYAQDLDERKEANYPPYSRLANVIVTSKNKHKAQQVVEAFAANVKVQVETMAGYELLGPAPCIKEKIKDKYRFHFEVKAPREAALGPLLADIARTIDTKGTSLAIDIDAYNTF